MNKNELLANPLFNTLSHEKRSFILQLVDAAANTDKDNILALFLKANNMMKSSQIKFSPEENELITSVLTSALTKEEQKKFELIKGLLTRPSK